MFEQRAPLRQGVFRDALDDRNPHARRLGGCGGVRGADDARALRRRLLRRRTAHDAARERARLPLGSVRTLLRLAHLRGTRRLRLHFAARTHGERGGILLLRDGARLTRAVIRRRARRGLQRLFALRLLRAAAEQSRQRAEGRGECARQAALFVLRLLRVAVGGGVNRRGRGRRADARRGVVEHAVAEGRLRRKHARREDEREGERDVSVLRHGGNLLLLRAVAVRGFRRKGFRGESRRALGL